MPVGVSPDAVCSCSVAVCVAAPKLPSAVSCVWVGEVAFSHWLSWFCHWVTAVPESPSFRVVPVVVVPEEDGGGGGGDVVDDFAPASARCRACRVLAPTMPSGVSPSAV